MHEKKVKILLDLPDEEGVLGFDNYRDALINIIKSTDPRFTVGIFGGWGTGKTTLMKMMKKKLDKERDITVWFNPWQFEKERHLMVPLLQTLKLELKTKYKDQVEQSILDKLGNIADSMAKSIKPEINLGIIKTSFNAKQFYEGKKDFTSLYFELNQNLKDIIKHIKKDRIVIFVDDLDRCLPDRALQVLESIKPFLDAEGYVFVIGLDRSIIEKCVDWKYSKQSGITGTDYIKKMIQLPFNLPGLREQEIKSYVQRLKYQLKGTAIEKHLRKYIDIISRGVEANPREIKRFINNFILVNQISAGEAEPAKLLVVLIIQFRWEELFKTIATYKKDFLDKLKFYIENKDNINIEDDNEVKTFKQKCSPHYEFFTLLESHPLFNFLGSEEGKILFEIEDLDRYIHFFKAVTIPELEVEIRTIQQLTTLLREEKKEEFNKIRQRPWVNLVGVILAWADLCGVDFSGAYLRGADLSYADLIGANLSLADLSGANLSRADLSRADLTGANLNKIVADDSTVFDKTIIVGVRNLSRKIRSTLYIEKEDGIEKATSIRGMKKT